MHQIALLRSENWILQEHNEILSKRRKAKKTHLQQGQSMTLGEGQDIQTQHDVEAQIREETRQSSGRKEGAETKGRRCGICGNPGTAHELVRKIYKCLKKRNLNNFFLNISCCG